MKLITTIIHERDRQSTCDALLQAGHQFTVIATTGGFLKDGNTTLLIGAHDDSVEEVIQIVKETCSTREQFVTQPPIDLVGTGGMIMNPVKVNVGGAIIFVVDVERFERV